jgi:hypothetical protein
MYLDTKERTRLAKLLNMLRSPIASERDAAVAKLNAIMATWSHDWNDVLRVPNGVAYGYGFMKRAAPEFRSMTPEECALVGELLTFRQAHEFGSFLSDTDRKMLKTLKKRGTITETQARKLQGPYKSLPGQARHRQAVEGVRG